MNPIHHIGIGKDTLHINVSELGSSTCSNQAKALMPWLRQLPARVHLVLEASGGYEKLLATLTHRTGGPIRQKPSPPQSLYLRLRSKGKPTKVALIACAKKLTTHLNSTRKNLQK